MQDVILKAREQARMTQAELAKAVGVSVDTIRRAEQGKHQPRATTLIRIARTLAIPLDQLVP